MSKLPADDLFEKSSMSFGEHLEELRKALMKAFLWLGLGTTIGLIFANRIVQFIHTPLKLAISDFYIDQAKAQFKEANGVEPSDKLAKWMTTEGMTPERVFIDPASLDFENEGSSGSTAASSSATGPRDASGTEAVSEDEDEKAGEEPPNPDASSATNEDPAAAKTNDAQEAEGGERKAHKAGEAAGDRGPPAEGKAAGKSHTRGEQATSEASVKAASGKSTPNAVAAAGGQAGGTNAEAGAQTFANPWKGIDLAKLERLRPLLIWRPVPNKLVTLNAIEGFMIWLKAGLVAGCVIGSPGILFHIWQFFAAGLYPHERRYVYWYLPLSLMLFLSGVFLAFFVVFRLVLGFLMTYTAGLDVEFTPRLNDYMSFALFLPLGFGIAFQLPIVMLGLHRFGIVSVATFWSQWRIAVLSIAFLSMMLTPADIYSMLGLFVPLVGLYFFGIVLCQYMPQGGGIGAPALDPQG